MAHAEQIVIRRLVEHGLDPRRRRTVPAERDHLGRDLWRTREHGFDAAVAAIAHPSLQVTGARLGFDPGAVADALHPAPDRHMKDGAYLAHFKPRNALIRALVS